MGIGLKEMKGVTFTLAAMKRKMGWRKVTVSFIVSHNCMEAKKIWGGLLATDGKEVA